MKTTNLTPYLGPQYINPQTDVPIAPIVPIVSTHLPNFMLNIG